MEAYQEMIQDTATKDTPWYVVQPTTMSPARVVIAAAVMEPSRRSIWPIQEVDEEEDYKELAAAKKKLLSK